jgi:hypothetical protein
MCKRTYTSRQLAVHITLQTRHDPSQQEAGYWQLHTNNHNKGTKDTRAQTKSVMQPLPYNDSTKTIETYVKLHLGSQASKATV